MWLFVFHAEGVVALASFCSGAPVSKCRGLICRGHATAVPLLSRSGSTMAGGLLLLPVLTVCRCHNVTTGAFFLTKDDKKRGVTGSPTHVTHAQPRAYIHTSITCTHTHTDRDRDGRRDPPQWVTSAETLMVLSAGCCSLFRVLLWWRADRFWQLQLLQLAGQSSL